MKNIRIVYLIFFYLLVVKFSVHLNRHVFVMWSNTAVQFSKTNTKLAPSGVFYAVEKSKRRE